jgi:hypothetical protein
MDDEEVVSVRIEANDKIVSFTGSDYGSSIAEALMSMRIGRICSEVARLVVDVAEAERIFQEHDTEAWPGYREAVSDMEHAARRLLLGWQKHDEEMFG